MYGTPRLDSSWGAQALVGVSYLYEIRILHPRDLLRSIQTYNPKIPLVPRILLTIDIKSNGIYYERKIGMENGLFETYSVKTYREKREYLVDI